MTIGDNIRKLRQAHDMTQEQLADALGKTRPAISQYETGVSVPRMGVIRNMCSVFNCEMHEIICDDVEYAVVSVPNAQENELLELFRTLDDTQQQALLSVARAMGQQ